MWNQTIKNSSELSIGRKSGPRLGGQITSQKRLAFVTVLFGLSSFNLGITNAEIYWLPYFIPLVAICYDLYIMSADSRIKRIGTFLG